MCAILQIPQPAGWGSFTPAYKRSPRRDLSKYPNRQVGDLSPQPTKGAQYGTLVNTPTGRLGIFHASLQKEPTRRHVSKSPNRQVGYLSRQPTKGAQYGTLVNTPTGRLGIFHASLQKKPKTAR